MTADSLVCTHEFERRVDYHLVPAPLVLPCSAHLSTTTIQASTIVKVHVRVLSSLVELKQKFGTVEGGIIAMIMDHDPKAWALGFDSRLLHLFILPNVLRV
ncbi:hypothetical protein L1887_16314 [Cichorium endivia]|nr:hypothetical protein L1887_16314 [Cichorium endivia]